MTNDTAPSLRPTEFGVLLGVAERRARQILGEVESLGFSLEVGPNGSRLIPAGLAAAVQAARAEGRELRALRLDPSLATYVRADKRTQALDPLDALVEVAAEVSILRELFGVLHDALRGGVARSSFVAPTNWRAVGVPDPRARL